MYFKIKKSDLNNLFSINEIDLDVNKLIIKKYVNDGNLLITNQDNEKTKIEKRIAYLTINYDEIFINLDGNLNDLRADKEQLMSALLSDATTIVLKIPSEILSSNLKNIYALEATDFIEPNNAKINENFLLSLTVDGWDNDEFIFKKLNSYDDNYSKQTAMQELSIELISYIPSEKWNSQDFLEKIFQNKYISKIFETAIQKEKNKTFDILYNTLILNKSIETNNTYLLGHYAKIYNEVTSQNSYGNYSLNKNRYEKSSKELLEKEINFINEIKIYFKDLKLANKLIKTIDSEYFNLFDKELRKDIDFKNTYIELALKHLQKRIQSGSIYSFTNLVGVDSFTDFRIQKFALENGLKISDDSYKPLLANEIIKRDNDEIIDLIKTSKGVDFLWEYLSKEQKNNKNIVCEMLKQNPKIYNKLSENLKLDKNMFRLYYEGLKQNELIKDFKIGKINKEFFESFSEEEMINLIENIPNFLLEEKFPKFFLENQNILVLSNINYHVYVELLKDENYNKQIQKVFNDKYLAMKMLNNNNYNVYEKFSEDVKSDMEVLTKYIIKTNSFENLPNKVFHNKNILINLLKYKTNMAEKIPAHYFEDQDFLLKIFKKVDNKELNHQVLSYLPTIINEVINSNEIKSGSYYDFFSKSFTNMNLEEKLSTGIKIKKNKI